MGILDDVFQEQVFEVIGLQVLPERIDIIDVPERCHGVPVVEPHIHGPDAVEQSLRTALVIIFPGREFRPVQGCFQHVLVDAFKGNIPESPVQHVGELLLLLYFRARHFHGPYGLLVAVAVGAGQVAADACIQDGLLQRCPVHIDEHVIQDAESQGFHGGHVVIHSHIEGMDPLSFGAFIFRDTVGSGHYDPLGKRRLGLHGGVHVSPVKGREVVMVHVGQGAVDIHIAVEENVAVRRMVETAVEFREFTERQGRNHFRVPAGLYAVGGIGEQLLHGPVFHDGFRRRQGSLHFVVYNAVVSQRCVLAFQFIVPAFLHENLGILQAVRIEYGIQVHIHKVVEIHIIPAGDEIHGLVGPGNGIQKRIEGALGQFHERFLQRIFPGAAEGGMLHDVGRALRIVRSRPEADIKDLVVIVIIQVHEPGAALHVLHHVHIGIDLFNMGHGAHTKTVDQVPFFPSHHLKPP